MAVYDLQYQDTHIDALLATANELKTAGYIYKGVATPSTNPGTPTERVAYLASEPGTYTNFGGIVITSGLYSLTYAGGTWTGTQMQAGSDIEVVQTTGDSTTDVMSQKAVTDEVEYHNIIAEVTLSGLAAKNGLMANATQWIIPGAGMIRNHVSIQVKAGDWYQLTANTTRDARMAFLTSDQIPTTNLQAIACVEGTESFLITAGSTSYFQIPTGCTYLAINKSNATADDFLPTSLYLVSATISIRSKIEEIDKSTQYYNAEKLSIYSFPSKNGYIANPTQWLTPASGTIRTHISIPVTAGDKYQIFAGSNRPTNYAFLTSDQIPITNLQTIACVAGTVSYRIPINNSAVIEIPTGCTYLAINKSLFVEDDSIPNAIYKVTTLKSISEDLYKLSSNDIAPFFDLTADWDIVNTDAVKGTIKEMKLIRGSVPNGSYIRYFGGRESVAGQFFINIYDNNGVLLSTTAAIIPTDGTLTTIYTSGICTFRLVIDGSNMKVNAGSTFYDWGTTALILNSKYLKVEGTPKRIVCFGDSITQFLDTEQSLTYPDYLARLSGCDVFNAGIGGTRLARRATPTTPISSETQAWAAVDISNLVSAWINNDWTIVDAAVTWLYNQNHSHDYRAKVATLKTIDPANVDIVTIFGGTNDFTGDSKLGVAGSTAIDEIAGALEVMINLLQTANPAIEIFAFTPIVRYIGNTWDDAHWSDNYISTGTNLNGKKLPDIAAFIESVCQYYHIPCRNWYWDLGWNRINFLNYFESTDGTHPYKGMDYIGEKMYLYLKSQTKLTK